MKRTKRKLGTAEVLLFTTTATTSTGHDMPYIGLKETRHQRDVERLTRMRQR
jgi:hypothetical protein